MVPDPDKRQISFPNSKYPPFRDNIVKLPELWLKGKRLHDGAEDLWRVHDNLYDLTNFISDHPGGSQWLLLTKGTDITESFETHHLKGFAETLLPKYFVRKAKTTRNYPFTFEEDGFYKTLKAKVTAKLSEIPKDCRKQSNSITDMTLLCLIISSLICCWAWTKSVTYGIISTIIVSYILSMVTICAHNYLHRADSWRMYLYNISGFSYKLDSKRLQAKNHLSCLLFTFYWCWSLGILISVRILREWRISHAMSHHLYTNTAHDLEISLLEPFLYYFPKQDKSILAQMGAIYYPVVYALTSIVIMTKDLVASLLRYGDKRVSWETSILFALPTWMWLASGTPLPQVVAIWLLIILTSSLIFMIFGLTAGHHSTSTFFEGDRLSNENLDWGVFQMLTVVENIDNSASHFKILTRFGSHCLHHLFPTLDHGELTYLYPLVMEHCEKFEMQLRRTSFYNALIEQSKQLTRKQPHHFNTSNNIQQLSVKNIINDYNNESLKLVK